jgi:hypothetical protein
LLSFIRVYYYFLDLEQVGITDTQQNQEGSVNFEKKINYHQ